MKHLYDYCSHIGQKLRIGKAHGEIHKPNNVAYPNLGKRFFQWSNT